MCASVSQIRVWRASRGRVWVLDAPRVVGVLNVTPDSFSDGGMHASVDDALRCGERMLSAGASGLDVGGESTRPGAGRVSAQEQIARVVPVIRALRGGLGDGFVISVDTTLSQVAAAALGEGADAINDVSGGQDDAGMFALAARHGAGLVIMHRLRPPALDVYSTGYSVAPEYAGGVVSAVCEHLRLRAEQACVAGVASESILLDPGLGFGKSVAQNLELIGGTGAVCGLGFGVLSALSRKSFTVPAAGLAEGTPPRERVWASVGLSIAHLYAGARVFRVHDVAEHVQALRGAWSGWFPRGA